MLEETLAIIKPDAVKNGYIGAIIARMEKEELSPIAIKMTILSLEQVRKFYDEHKDKAFFSALVDYMVTGKVVLLVLKGEDAILRYRKLMGNTDPNKAEAGTLRADFADNIEANAVHGSADINDAKRELSIFFPELYK